MSINVIGVPAPVNIEALPNTPAKSWGTATHQIEAFTNAPIDVQVTLGSIPITALQQSANNSLTVTPPIVESLSIVGLVPDSVEGTPINADVDVQTGNAVVPFTGQGAVVSTFAMEFIRETPEQVAILIDADSFDSTAYATLEYKLTSEPTTWTQAHPLYRVRPGQAEDAFAGCIFGLATDSAYDIRATITDLSGTQVSQGQYTTRALPAAAGTPTATPASVSALQTDIDNAVAGNVIELQDGNYTLTSTIDVDQASGTEGNEIYLRGESRTGTIINLGNFDFSVQANYWVFENMTLVGNKPANSTSTQRAFDLAEDTGVDIVYGITIRNIVASNITRFVQTNGGSTGEQSHNCLIYNNRATGVAEWSETNLLSSTMWNNDGIRIVGYGNCVWNNTLEGFGDSITFAHSADETSFKIECNYAYRNFIRNSLNDTFELDHCERFIGVYDNYCENVDTGVSQSDNSTVDNLGPTYVFRNIFVNIADKWFKPTASWEGWHWYSNTFVRPDALAGESFDAAKWGFGDGSPSGNQTRFSYRNNMHIFRGANSTLWDVTWRTNTVGMEEYDMSHNAYYPDGKDVYFRNKDGTRYNGILAAIAAGKTHTPLYPSGAGLANTNDRYNGAVLSVSNPFVNTLTTGSDVGTEVTGAETLELAAGTAKNAGVEIPGITDDYSGIAPDMGAVIEGRAAVTYGWSGDVPSWANIASGTVALIGTSVLDDVHPAYKLGGNAQQIVDAWGGGTIVFVSDRFYYAVRGGGHNDYSGNELYLWGPLDSESPVWVIDHGPTNPTVANVLWQSDGLPSSSHTRNTMVGGPLNELWLFGQGGVYNDLTSSNEIMRYDFSTDSWDAQSTHPNFSGSARGAYAYNPNDGKLWGVGSNGNFRLFSYDGTTYTEYGSTIGTLATNCGAIDTTRNNFYVANSSGQYLFDLDNPATAPLTSFTGTPQQYSSVSYDAVRDVFMSLQSNSPLTTVSEMNPATRVWSTNSYSGTSSTPLNGDYAGHYGRWVYSSFLDGHLFVGSTTNRVAFYKS